MFGDKEIFDFFKKLDIETDIKRQNILFREDFNQGDESTKINCVLIDKITVVTKEGEFGDVELE